MEYKNFERAKEIEEEIHSLKILKDQIEETRDDINFDITLQLTSKRFIVNVEKDTLSFFSDFKKDLHLVVGDLLFKISRKIEQLSEEFEKL